NRPPSRTAPGVIAHSRYHASLGAATDTTAPSRPRLTPPPRQDQVRLLRLRGTPALTCGSVLSVVFPRELLEPRQGADADEFPAGDYFPGRPAKRPVRVEGLSTGP